MKSIRESEQVLRGAEMRVNRVDVILPVAMVCLSIMSILFDILVDLEMVISGGLGHKAAHYRAYWRYPNGIKTHALNVIKFRNDPLPRPSAVVRHLAMA